ncbi:MAG: MFS transporter [Phycisphaera sp.]|nr:MFS transporter [Phycisphaera sp.]
MSSDLTNAEKIRRLKWGLCGDVANVIYCSFTFGMPVFLLYLDKLGLDKSQIGTLLSLIAFAGLTAPILGPLVARIGVKRMFMFSMGTRALVFAVFLLAPWLAANYGLDSAYLLAIGIMVVFALLRSTAENAGTLWNMEFVPVTIRGRYTSLQVLVALSCGAVTVFIVSRVLGQNPPIERFMILQGASVMFALLTMVFYSRILGGGPMFVPPSSSGNGGDSIFSPLRDGQFRRLLLGSAIFNLGWGVMAAFLPLFMKEQVGLRTDQVVLLDGCAMVAGLMSSFFWGWAADRYGGRPVMLFNLCLMTLYPVSLLFVPRQTSVSFHIVAGLAFLVGLVGPGWGIGYTRYLFINLIPQDKRTRYITLHSAWVGLVAGTCPIIAGEVLDRTRHLNGSFGYFHLDPYTPLLVVGPTMALIAVGVLSGLHAGGGMPVRRFAAMFVQGDPFAALRALVAFQFAGFEHQRIGTIERLGQTQSPLSIDELVASLNDPSFNVRYEAVVSIARMRQDDRLTTAMVSVLREGDVDLRVAAAWALGRMGDAQALPALREALASPYSILRARSARALGMLGDRGCVNELVGLFNAETDPGVRVAYAAALAALDHTPLCAPMLNFLASEQDTNIRRELSLAIATLMGKNAQALRLWRRMEAQPGDTLAGVMLSVKRHVTQPDVSNLPSHDTELLLNKAVKALGHDDLQHGTEHLIELVLGLKLHAFTDTAQTVITRSTEQLRAAGHERMEYLLLLVHALHVGVKPTQG